MSFAIVTLVLTMSLPILSTAAARQADRLHRLRAGEFAVSILEEYRLTYPQMAATGADLSGWAWSIAESRIVPDGPTSLDNAMHLVQLDLEVWDENRPRDSYKFVTIVARLGP